MAALTKESIPLGMAYSFRGLLQYHHSRKHGDRQAVTVLEKGLRVGHPDL